MAKLIIYIEQRFGYRASRTQLRSLLKRQRLSWKKCHKRLSKADPEKRQAFMRQLASWWTAVCRQEIILLYIDEAHLHRDLDLGYTWAPKGELVYGQSVWAPLCDRINWYGAYHFSAGQCLIWNEGNCNQEHTGTFLQRVAAWLGPPTQPVVIIWDGAPWHRAAGVQQKAQALGFQLLPLPGYSPDLNPIEGLWKWLREDVTQLHSYPTMRQLFDACKIFIDRINLDPDALIKRLWPKFDLDPDFEKLLIS